ncbi:hypothetical protein B0O99DRAFT_520398 [Bisporella sp. PMI_857]|nr:hypothetical protein B0O99DRAFT_520398 [Bisporella sp. PMI_857]
MATPVDKLSDALRDTPVLEEHRRDQNPVASRQSQHGAAARRNRSQLSCTQCRHAKSRCDRQQPCSQCVKRGKSSQCTFPAPAIRKKPAVSMQNRLNHLESLVKKAMTAQSLGTQRTPPREELVNRTANEYNIFNTPAFNVSESPRVRASADAGHPADYRTEQSQDGSWNSSGSVVQSSNETTYIGATHWAAILDDIEEVKGYFNTEDSDDEPDDIGVKPETSIIFHSSTTTKEDIIAALPAKDVVNQLMLRYFVSNSPAISEFTCWSRFTLT